MPAKKEKSVLRRYVESFSQAAMVETARIVSAEGAALVERQTSALVSAGEEKGRGRKGRWWVRGERGGGGGVWDGSGFGGRHR